MLKVAVLTSKVLAVSAMLDKGYPEYDPEQPRDSEGRFSDSGGLSTQGLNDDKVEVFRKPTQEELAAFQGYQSEKGKWRKINRELRSHSEPSESSRTFLAAMDSFTATAEVTQDSHVWRGVSQTALDAWGELKEGQTLVDSGYLSASMHDSVAGTFAAGGDFGLGAVMQIELPAGSKLGPVFDTHSAYVGEGEIILPRGSKFVYKGKGIRFIEEVGDVDVFYFSLVKFTKGYPEFDPDQPRDSEGRFSDSGGSSAPTLTAGMVRHLREPTADELRAVSDYQDGSVNEAMRNDTTRARSLRSMTRIIAALDSYTQTSEAAQDAVVWRGVSRSVVDAWGKLSSDKVFRDSGYLSASLLADAAFPFARTSDPRKTGGLMQITLPKGSKFGAIYRDPSGYTHEEEILLPRGSKLKYTGAGTKLVGGRQLKVFNFSLVE